MGLTLSRLSLLIPMVFVVAFCASVMDSTVQGSPAMAARVTREPVRFIGSDSPPAQQKTTIHTTVDKPTSHVQEPIPQDRTLDMIRAILALHDLDARTKQAESSNSMSESTAVEHGIGGTVLKESALPQGDSFAYLANQASDQQSILRSFAENDTVVTGVTGVSEVDFPCFGDGYCCCEGCPPGSCPFMFVSVDTGARSPEFLANKAVTCPCAVPGEYCCCAGCPRGTCRSGSC